MDNKFFICSCGSLEHQMYFWYDREYNELYTEIHLITYRNFFKRLWRGLKYAFGYKSRHWAWDEFLFDDEQQKELFNFLKDNFKTI